MKAPLFLIATLCTIPFLWAADSDIRLNSLGFLPKLSKKAAITASASRFFVRNASNHKRVFQGTVSGSCYQKDIDQEVGIADFSKVTKKGQYYLDVPGVGRSIDFRIGDAFDSALYTSMRGFYLLRCGTEVRGEHQGTIFSHGPCHLEDGWMIGIDDSIHRDGTGGWHDAGDYGKYVVNAGVTVGVLFMTWEHFHKTLENYSFDLPDTIPNYPDFLKEMKWETDWLLKMVLPDDSGKVAHKLTRTSFSGFIMPEEDLEKRYFVDWSTEATADFTAMMAMASRYFNPYDTEYAERCLHAARKSYAFLKQHPEQKHANQRRFRTGRYPSKDNDDRMWAAAELWETTGDMIYLTDFEAMAALESKKIDAIFDWGNVKNMGMFTYVLSQRPGRNQTLTECIQKDLIAIADTLVLSGDRDVYNRTMADSYWWGCNGALARQTVILYAANRISPDSKYVNAGVNIVDHLFGRNYYGRSYVTGVGYLPPLHPHDRRSGSDGIEPPWPGYLIGGGETATGWHDEERDFRTNEICINWQAALVYALGWMVDME